MEYIEQLNKEIKEKLAEIKQLKIEKDNKKEEMTQNVQEIVEKLKKKRNRAIIHLYRNVYRIKKAFPAVNTKEITEILSKKIDLKKKDKNT